MIEIKPGRLDSGALEQALYYASSLARLDADELRGKLEPGLAKFGDPKTLSARVKQQLDGEGEEREIAVLLVGAGVHSGLERMNEFLARFDVPIGIVSFEVFKLVDGPQLLIREVVDEPTESDGPISVDAIRAYAAEVGVREQFDRFVKMSEQAGLPVQPQRASVRVAPPANRTRFLMYAGPRTSASGGELGIWVGPGQFAEWFPHIDENKAVAALGKYDDGGYLTGQALNDRLDEIERFLTESFPPQD